MEAPTRVCISDCVGPHISWRKLDRWHKILIDTTCGTNSSADKQRVWFINSVGVSQSLNIWLHVSNQWGPFYWHKIRSRIALRSFHDSYVKAHTNFKTKKKKSPWTITKPKIKNVKLCSFWHINLLILPVTSFQSYDNNACGQGQLTPRTQGFFALSLSLLSFLSFRLSDAHAC